MFFHPQLGVGKLLLSTSSPLLFWVAAPPTSHSLGSHVQRWLVTCLSRVTLGFLGGLPPSPEQGWPDLASWDLPRSKMVHFHFRILKLILQSQHSVQLLSVKIYWNPYSLSLLSFHLASSMTPQPFLIWSIPRSTRVIFFSVQLIFPWISASVSSIIIMTKSRDALSATDCEAALHAFFNRNAREF